MNSKLNHINRKFYIQLLRINLKKDKELYQNVLQLSRFSSSNKRFGQTLTKLNPYQLNAPEWEFQFSH